MDISGLDIVTKMQDAILNCDRNLNNAITEEHLQETYQNLVANPSLGLRSKMDNQEEIVKTITLLNDVCRIAKIFADCTSDKSMQEKLNGCISELLKADLLRIEVAFFGLKNVPNSIGKLTLIDTAGFNEHLLGQELKQATKVLLKDSSAVVCIVDAGQQGTHAEGQLQSWVKEGREVYICANQKDRYRDAGYEVLQTNNFKKYSGIITKLRLEDVFTTDARKGLFSNKLQQEFAATGKYPMPKPNDKNDPMAEMLKECFGQRKLKDFNAATWSLSAADSKEFTAFLSEQYDESGIPKLIADVFVVTAHNLIPKVFISCLQMLVKDAQDLKSNLETFDSALVTDLEALLKQTQKLRNFIKQTKGIVADAENLPGKIAEEVSGELEGITVSLQGIVQTQLNALSEMSAEAIKKGWESLKSNKQTGNGSLGMADDPADMLGTKKGKFIFDALANVVDFVSKFSDGYSSQDIARIRKINDDFNKHAQGVMYVLESEMEQALREKNLEFKKLIRDKLTQLQEQFNQILAEFADFMGQHYDKVSLPKPDLAIPAPEISIGAMGNFMESESEWVDKEGLLNAILRKIDWGGNNWGQELITYHSFNQLEAMKAFKKSAVTYLNKIKDALLAYVKEDLTTNIKLASIKLENAIGEKRHMIDSAVATKKKGATDVEAAQKKTKQLLEILEQIENSDVPSMKKQTEDLQKLA